VDRPLNRSDLLRRGVDRYLDCANPRRRAATRCARAGTSGDAVIINDAHCHFFSSQFFGALARQRGTAQTAGEICGELHWDDPGPADALADRWIAELDLHGVSRAALIASVPGDEVSVAQAVARHPARFVGFFMLDPAGADATDRARRA